MRVPRLTLVYTNLLKMWGYPAFLGRWLRSDNWRYP